MTAAGLDKAKKAIKVFVNLMYSNGPNLRDFQTKWRF